MRIGFDGYAIGGVSVGEPETEMMAADRILRAVAAGGSSALRDGARDAAADGRDGGTRRGYVRLRAARRGIARNGTAFTSKGTINLKNAEYRFDGEPIERDWEFPGCLPF